jgi:hypothetical protein
MEIDLIAQKYRDFILKPVMSEVALKAGDGVSLVDTSDKK